ncbi:septation protein A [Dichotomicrobium thermohalophilum]|uniref:Inner membrane-spanning protein YciB n=1 Tax=Dichotomicrobium thermohalophilum TaxID=933063 RepID=A0A397Q9U7_9HYPH|nr:septation protein A [Dichotomicrobium thermohalophilum]RIA56287.1 intracellular septation protein [Dichotomicrobium thermohalophilum]
MTETPPSQDETMSPSKQGLKLLVEIGPLVVFFIGNTRYDIFVATGAFMAATAVSLLASRLIFKRIPAMPLVTGIFVFIMGGLTLYLHDELFIKLKPTIVNVLFASILLGGLAYGHSLLKYLFSDVFQLLDEGWRKLTLRWALFFLFLAVLNEIVWRFFSTDFWVAFKVFGIMPLTLIFSIMQLGLMQRYQIDASEKRELASQ